LSDLQSIAAPGNSIGCLEAGDFQWNDVGKRPDVRKATETSVKAWYHDIFFLKPMITLLFCPGF